jgi:hypothetical protein
LARSRKEENGLGFLAICHTASREVDLRIQFLERVTFLSNGIASEKLDFVQRGHDMRVKFLASWPSERYFCDAISLVIF